MIDIKNGFTLIELLVVIALVGLLATLGIMQHSYLNSTIARMEVDKFATVCSFLQQHAITTNNEQILTCDTKNNEYHGNNVHEKLSQQIAFGFLPGTMGSPGNPTHHIEKAVTFPGSVIHFYPTGIISSGTSYFVDKQKQCMYALSNAVSQVSYVRLYRYDGSWKML